MCILLQLPPHFRYRHATGPVVGCTHAPPRRVLGSRQGLVARLALSASKTASHDRHDNTLKQKLCKSNQ